MNASTATTMGPEKTEAGVSSRAEAHRGSNYFTTMAGLMLAINFVGFAPSYYLKAHFETAELPLRTHFHGVLFSAWFVLYLAQTLLVRRGSLRLHRRLGTAGGILALVMAVSGLAMLYYRALEVRLGGDDAMLSLIVTSTVVWGNLVLVGAFSTFVALGIYFRSRPEAHRRLMLLGSVSMMLQAIGRIGRFPGVPGSEVAWGLGGLVALLLSLVLFDAAKYRRLHPVTRWGPPVFLVTMLLCVVVVPRTSLGQALIIALAS